MRTQSYSKDTVVSCLAIVPDRASPKFEQYVAALHADLRDHFEQFEILLIGRSPKSWIYTGFSKSLKNLPFLRLLNVSHSISSEVATSAAFESAIGDFVVIWQPGRDPNEAVVSAIKLGFSGHGAVMGETVHGRTIAYILGRNMVGLALRLIDGRLPSNATGLWCLSRDVILALSSNGNYHQDIFSRVEKLMLTVTPFNYDVLNKNEHKKRLTHSISATWKRAVFNSMRPLRFVMMMGMTASVISLFVSCYSIFSKFLIGSTAEGWASLLLVISFFFSVLFIILAILSEYLDRFLNELSGQRDFIVTNEILSKSDQEFAPLNIISSEKRSNPH